MFRPKRRAQRFCRPAHRQASFRAQFVRKVPKPKRIRTRERERLYTIIHRGQSLQHLRELAAKALGFPENWGKLESRGDHPEFNCDPRSSAFSEETIEQLREQAREAARVQAMREEA